MKHIIYSTIIAFLLVHIMAMKHSNDEPAPIYNRVSNKELIKMIEEFIMKHKGQPVDKDCKFLKLSIKKYEDNYRINVSYIPDHTHNSLPKEPIIICAPIAGKKIVVDYGLSNVLISPNTPEMALYFKDDCPEIYNRYIEKYNKYKNVVGFDSLTEGWLYESPFLNITFDYRGKLIDSTYFDL